MNGIKKELICNLLYEEFVECCVEEVDTLRIKMNIPEMKKQLTAIIAFNMEDMEG